MKRRCSCSGELSPAGPRQSPRGVTLLQSSLSNKGTAFTDRERDSLGLRGLLPPRVFSMDEQVVRVLGNFRRKQSPLEKYIFLGTLQNRNETLFYRVLLDHLEEMMPIIYTPTVGQACLEYGSIFRRPRGLWISINECGRIAEVLRNWPHRGVRIIVVTDGERILGLGDLGALGMGIPVGKLALYTACAGIHPAYCLPITLDVGTDNADLIEDPLYIGLPQRRVRGDVYAAFLDEFIDATQLVFPGVLVQFEDFAGRNAFAALDRYRDRICCFNDDIQGTAAVAVAGLLATTRITGRPLADQLLLFYGAGEAGTGIANLVVRALVAEGLPEATARRRCWLFDSQGLVVRDRPGTLARHKQPFAHEHPPVADFDQAIETLRPTALIGVAGIGRAFTPPRLARLAALNERPIIFALSNPTSKAECTAEEAYDASDGRAVFASGSPFPPVTRGDRTFHPGQGNNVYVFPGIGLGALAVRSRHISDCMFLAAARALAGCVTEGDLAVGRVYPPLTAIREVSIKIAVEVAGRAYEMGLARRPATAAPAALEEEIRASMFAAEYPHLA